MERRLLRVIRGQDCRTGASAVGTADFNTGTSVTVKCAEGTGRAGLPQEAGTSLPYDAPVHGVRRAREQLVVSHSASHQVPEPPPGNSTWQLGFGRSRSCTSICIGDRFPRNRIIVVLLARCAIGHLLALPTEERQVLAVRGSPCRRFGAQQGRRGSEEAATSSPGARRVAATNGSCHTLGGCGEQLAILEAPDSIGAQTDPV